MLHATIVEELHIAVMHRPSASWAVLVGSAKPKSSPMIATHPPPVIGALTAMPLSTVLTTGASKLYTELAVPATSPTLTPDTQCAVLTALLRHASVVAECIFESDALKAADRARMREHEDAEDAEAARARDRGARAGEFVDLDEQRAELRDALRAVAPQRPSRPQRDDDDDAPIPLA